MNKNFEKNRLDLAYQKQLSYLNAILTLLTTGVVSFLTTIFIKREFILEGIVIFVVFLLIAGFWFKKVDTNMKNISDEIKRL